MTTWPYISRNVGPTVERWLNKHSNVLLIRGNRRVGKSTTIQASLIKLNINFIQIIIDGNENVTLENIGKKFLVREPIKIFEVGHILADKIRQGTTIVLEEIQNCSPSFQISLQEGIDYIAQQRMFRPTEWKDAGNLILMGSLPGLVDIMIESRKNPLYQRITAKVSIQPFDTQELCRLFRSFNLLSNPSLLLTLKTIFGGMPGRYQQAFELDLLKPTTTQNELLKKFVAAELQNESRDAHAYYRESFGEEVATGLKAVMTLHKKGEQIKAVSERLRMDSSSAFSFLYYDLYTRYGLIFPEYGLDNAKTIARFKVTEPLLLLMDFINDGIEKQDLRRTIDDSDIEKLSILEGPAFEQWIREIVEDRYMLLENSPILPHPHFDQSLRHRPIIETSTFWNTKKTEIDFIASLPTTNRLLIGSCKRSVSQIDLKNLQGHWKHLQDQDISGLLQRLKIKDLTEFKVIFILFVAVCEKTDQELQKFRENLPQDCYLFTLQDLLTDFS